MTAFIHFFVQSLKLVHPTQTNQYFPVFPRFPSKEILLWIYFDKLTILHLWWISTPYSKNSYFWVSNCLESRCWRTFFVTLFNTLFKDLVFAPFWKIRRINHNVTPNSFFFFEMQDVIYFRSLARPNSIWNHPHHPKALRAPGTLCLHYSFENVWTESNSFVRTSWPIPNKSLSVVAYTVTFSKCFFCTVAQYWRRFIAHVWVGLSLLIPLHVRGPSCRVLIVSS